MSIFFRDVSSINTSPKRHIYHSVRVTTLSLFFKVCTKLMRLIASISLCISYLTVEGSTGFLQCFGMKPKKREEEMLDGVEIYNIADSRFVSERTDKKMSALYAPAIPIVTSEYPRRMKRSGLEDEPIDPNIPTEIAALARQKCSSREYQNKMVLNTGSSKSYFNPENHTFWDGPKTLVTMKLGPHTRRTVSAITDSERRLLVGQVGVGPHSPLMGTVGKLELTIRDGKYTRLRSGEEVKTKGFIFSDIVKHDKYPEAWAVIGAIRHLNTKENLLKPVNIIFDTLSRPPNTKPDTSRYSILIPLVAHQKHRHEIIQGEPIPETRRESFLLDGDQFFYLDEKTKDTIVVNPIVLGYKKDIRIVFSVKRRPKMAIKVLQKPT